SFWRQSEQIKFVKFLCSTLRDYFGLIFDELFTVFDSRGEFSRLNVFFILTVKKLLQEVY
ncbi:MAG: hypothetical protein ACRC6M_08575, partial [Microcystaceae cyanobacterium]